MATQIKRGVNIYIDQQEAEKALQVLQLRFYNLTKKLQQLEEQGKKGNATWQKTVMQLDKVDKELKQTTTEINLTDMSMSQLKASASKLQNQLNKSQPNTPEWEKYNNALSETRVEMDRLKQKSKDTENALRKTETVVQSNESSWTKFSNGISKAKGAIVAGIAAITGIAYTVKNFVEEYAKLEDTFSDVRKTTNLTTEEVKELDKSLKSYDTRTSREELMKLAVEAGKIGIAGRKDIKDFVEQADKIKVALGEDLGEEGVTNIAKIASVFGLMKSMGIDGSLNAIGSAINALGQDSSAAEEYIVEFTHRLGGVGALAGISVQNIMGYGSALDQTGRGIEESASSVQQFLMKMMAEPAKFAKIAGLEVKDFVKLVSTDANQAFLKVLATMKDRGGFQAMIPMFSDMGTEGIRVVGTISAMANKLDLVKEAQLLSNKSFSEGTSLLNEFNYKNQNAQANLDKQKKKLLENTVALGEKLYPAYSLAISGANGLLKAIGYLANNFNVILTLTIGLTTAYIAYNAAQLKDIAVKKIRLLLMGSETTAVNLATIAQNIWNNAIKANPIGMLLSLLTLAISSIMLYKNNIDETTTSQKLLNDAEKETSNSLSEEKAKIQVLIAQITNENLSREERNEKLKELIALSPENLKNLTLENIATKEGTVAIENYLKQLKEKIHLENLQKKLAEADKNLESAKRGDNITFWDKTKASLTSFEIFGAKSYKKQLEDTKKEQISAAKNAYDEIYNQIQEHLNSKPINFLSKTENENNSSTSETEKQRKAREKAEKKAQIEEKKLWEKEIKNLEDELKQKQAINEKAFEERSITEEQYNRINLDDELKFNNKKLDVLKKHKQNTGEVELEIAKIKTQIRKQGYSQEIKLLEDAADEYKLNLEKSINNGKITQEEYNVTMIAFELAQMYKRLAIQKKYGDNTIALETEIERKKRELHEAMINQEDNSSLNPPALSESAKLDVEEAKVKLQYQQNLINKKEYEDAMRDIAKRRWEDETTFLKDFFEKTNEFSQESLTAVNGFRDADLTNAETTYNKEEKALKNKLDRGLISQEEYDTQKNTLEEKYQDEQKKIKKKYAAVDLAINIAKIISETALSIMKAWGELGPIAGIPFAAIMGVAGAAQIASATAQYNQVQGLEKGLYPTVTRSQDGKKFKVNSVNKTQTGVYSQPSVLVGENGPELVVDNKRFNKIMRERPEIINYIVNGYEKGKYPTFSKAALNAGNDNRLIKSVMQMINDLNNTINGSDIFALRKGLKKADKVVDKINNKFN